MAFLQPPQIETRSRGSLLRWIGWFAFLNGCLTALIGIRYVAYMGQVNEIIAQAYLPVAIFSHFTLLALVPALLLVPVALVWPRLTPLTVLGIFVASSAIVILIIDTVVYSQYRFHLNGFVVALIWDAGDEIFDFSWFTWATAAAITAAVILVEFLLARLARWQVYRKSQHSHLGIYAATLFVLALLTSQFTHAVADAAYLRSITSLTRHLPLYRPVTAKSLLQKTIGLEARAEQPSVRINSANSGLRYPIRPLDCETPAVKPNLIWIVIDSWRADALGNTLTPNLSAFSEHYPVSGFANHFSGGNGTRPGIFSLFYGLPASYWTAFYGTQVPPVLMQQLADEGYEFGIFASAKLTRPSFDRTVFSLIPDLRLSSDGNHAWERDADIVKDWRQLLDTRDTSKPLFGFLFFDSAHAFSFPPDYPKMFDPIWKRVDHLALNNDFDPLPYRNRYNQSLHYVDSLIGEVMTDLAEHDLINSSVIMITSDHGEEFNELKQGYWGHGSNYSRYQAQVPLLVHWPGKPAVDYAHTTSHMDIAPTLMRDLFACTNDFKDISTGSDLWDTTLRSSVTVSGYLEYGILEPDRTTVLYQTGDFDVYDPDYVLLPDQTLSPEVSSVVLDTMSRFYR